MAEHLRRTRLLIAGVSLVALAACEGETLTDFDFDMRGSGGSAADTSAAARGVAAARPAADNRGIISYPSYQVAVANPGDTVTTVAGRIGVPPDELARLNGLPPDAPLRGGEVLVLPGRVAEPSAATGAITTGPITPGSVDITTLAGGAIDRAGTGTAPATSTVSSGEEPVRHQVQPGETAFIIARRYNVSVEALADWNGLPADYSVRVGQYLLIPIMIGAPTATPAAATTVAAAAPVASTVASTTAPGQGSATPTPPSAAQPLPEESPGPTPAPAPEPENLEPERTAASAAQFQMPVNGSIVRDYDADDFTGIGISASAGSAVNAADAGTVMLITRDTNQNAILVIRHEGDLLTVYSGIDDIRVERGDSVSRGQQVAVVKAGDPASLFFQVRQGNETFDPLPYLQ
jgi:murein DD-endopeptidase MepM/ murein hydrolase activator NlpD